MVSFSSFFSAASGCFRGKDGGHEGCGQVGPTKKKTVESKTKGCQSPLAKCHRPKVQKPETHAWR